MEEVFDNRYKEVVKQKEQAENEKFKLVQKLMKVKVHVQNLRKEMDKLKNEFLTKYDDIRVDVESKLAEVTNMHRKTKKLMLSRPRVPDINLKIIFDEYILLLQNDAPDLKSLGLKGEIQSEKWALAIINLIYLDKTKKDTEDYFVS